MAKHQSGLTTRLGITATAPWRCHTRAPTTSSPPPVLLQSSLRRRTLQPQTSASARGNLRPGQTPITPYIFIYFIRDALHTAALAHSTDLARLEFSSRNAANMSCVSFCSPAASMQRTSMFNTSKSTARHGMRSVGAGRQAAIVPFAAPPKGVSQPPRSPVTPPPKFGFVENAEVMNSRAAMIGFFSLLLVEAVAGKGLLELIGVTVGKGLDIGL